MGRNIWRAASHLPQTFFPTIGKIGSTDITNIYLQSFCNTIYQQNPGFIGPQLLLLEKMLLFCFYYGEETL